METPIYFNEIRILQSLKSSESHTGTQLYDDLINYKHRINFEQSQRRFDVLLNDFETWDQLLSIFEDIKKQLKENSRLPIIHFELHGNPKGIGLSSDEFIPWESVIDELTKINIMTRNNLVLSMGVCCGAYLGLKSFEKGVLESGRSTFVVLIGSMQNIPVSSIYQSFYNFYSKLLTGYNFNEAAENMDTPGSLYFATSASNFVKQLIIGIKMLMQSSEFEKDALNNVQKSIENTGRKLNADEFQNELVKVKSFMTIHYKVMMQRIWESYVMIDLYKDNQNRFESFDEIWNQASSPSSAVR